MAPGTATPPPPHEDRTLTLPIGQEEEEKNVPHYSGLAGMERSEMTGFMQTSINLQALQEV